MRFSEVRLAARPLRQLAGQTRQRAVQLRGQVADQVRAAIDTGPAPALPEAPCSLFAVFDGAALTLRARLPGRPAPVARDAPPASAAVVFSCRGRRLPAPARLDPGPDGWLVDALVPLGDGPGESPLTPGVWRVELAVDTGGQVHRYRPRAPAAPPAAGPTLPDPPHPLLHRRYRAVRGPGGAGLIRVEELAPCAEVIRIIPRPDTVEIRVRLFGVRGGQPALCLVPRHRGPELAARMSPAGPDQPDAPDQPDLPPVLRAGLPVDQLASGADGQELTWDAWVRPQRGASPVRAGRYRRGVGNPRTVFRVNQVTVALSADRFVGVRPYYTAAGNLAVACVPFTSVRPDSAAPHDTRRPPHDTWTAR